MQPQPVKLDGRGCRGCTSQRSSRPIMLGPYQRMPAVVHTMSLRWKYPAGQSPFRQWSRAGRPLIVQVTGSQPTRSASGQVAQTAAKSRADRDSEEHPHAIR